MKSPNHSRTLAARLFAIALLLAGTGRALADLHYVDVNSTNATPPYTNWTTAATSIQDAVDAVMAGDEIVVTNGIYATGGRAVDGALTNRVAVDKPLMLRSVNGPQFTVIQGHQVPGTTNGDGAIRCVYLARRASLSGFTLTNGATRTTNDYGGGAFGGTLTNCTLAGNSSPSGGGASLCNLRNCTLTGNAGDVGGGAYNCTLNNCTVTGNSCRYSAGGAYESTLNNCTLTGNSAGDGGGGAFYCTLNNCTVSGNSAGYGGGGASYCKLNNCTVTGNSAFYGGGVANLCTLNNCILYFNTALQLANYDYSSAVNYCCTTPLPADGVRNISLDPQLASAWHLSAASPCRGAGNSAYATSTDIDGESWASPPSIGCDEYHEGAVIGSLNVAIAPSFTNVLIGFTVQLTALIEGRSTWSVWDFGEGVTVTNQPYIAHAWAALGDYPVVLRAYNESRPGGVSATVTVHVVAQPVHYVAAASANPVAPYTSWATAATNIQDAVDAATVPGALLLIANGTYATGGRAMYGTLTNRVAVDKALNLQSVNGPQFTVIQGYQVPGATNGDGAIRCVYLARGATLSGFTLTGEATRAVSENPPNRESSGGGVWCESTNNGAVSNCVVAGNSAASYGGGAYGGALNNCTLIGNSALGYADGIYNYPGRAGGAYACTLNNCTLTGNTASSGAGADNCTLNNCTLRGNFASSNGYNGAGGARGCTLNDCTVTGNSGAGAGSSILNNCTLADNSGAGADSSTLNNCVLTGNLGAGASSCRLTNCTLTGNSGGGASGATLNNCVLSGNEIGASGSTLNNCTLTGNSGVGASGSALNNCILYFNTAVNYDAKSTLNYCCTTPQPANGVGNISLDPRLASAWHLSAASPCRGAGNSDYATSTDIDGEAWANPPSIGCDEYDAGAVTGPLNVAISTTFTNVAPGFALEFSAVIEGRTTASAWDFGDGITVTNQPYTAHAWAALGDYAVVLRAYNDSQPGGVSATVTVHVVAQPVHYVAAASANPVAPYTSWATAATNIQDAVDAATVPGALLLIANGIYATGGRAMHGTLTNRVAVDKALNLQSVNGPQFTVIQGYHVPGTANGDGAVRCVYLARGAILSGFTLTNGGTRAVSDDPTFRESAGGGVWCESTNTVVVSNCLMEGNSAYATGGGAYGGTLNGCTLTGNSTVEGGGASYGMLNNCTVTGNSCRYSAGGAYESTLNNCTLTGNSASDGGGGAFYCTLNNCTVSGNSAGYGGGGASYCKLNNCTVTGNSAFYGGGVANLCTLNNCILYFNTALQLANYDYSSAVNYCCTTPLPTNGVGNISSDPQLASASHLSVFSPCIGQGNYAAVSGVDIDGEPWANSPSIGCDEYHAGAVTGPISVAITASFTNVVAGYSVGFTALIEGRTDLSIWDFGDGALAINQPYTAHSWAMPGDYLVSLWAFNDSYPGGISATFTVHLGTGLHYVAANSTNPVSPYTSWTTAATNIQDAINASEPGAQVVVTNGTYGRITTSILTLPGAFRPPPAPPRPLSVRSVNGALFTIIDGGHSGSCALLGNDVSLSGFTLTNGSAANGGGASGGTLNDCTLVGNWAHGSDHGYWSFECHRDEDHDSCDVVYHSFHDPGYGGGAYGCTLNNCTLAGNSSADYGGGAASCTLNNCIVYFNTAPQGVNYSGGTLSYCCTTPLPTNGFGNITSGPLFVDTNGWANLRLQSNSPCINAGDNAFAPAVPDFDSNPRIAGGTVDIGAYEFPGPLSQISYAWLQQYNLATDGSADTADPDGDGLNNWQEWRCGTDPTNALSALRLLAPVNGGTNVTVTWESVVGVNYFLERASDLGASPSFIPLATGIPGQPGTITYTDTNATEPGPWFYRVGVSGP